MRHPIRQAPVWSSGSSTPTDDTQRPSTASSVWVVNPRYLLGVGCRQDLGMGGDDFKQGSGGTAGSHPFLLPVL